MNVFFFLGTLQTWSLIAHGITTNPNDLAGGSGTGEGGKTGVDGGRSSDNNGQQYASHPASGAVVEAFDGSENTIQAGDSSSSSLQNSGAPLPAHAGVAKPVSIVGRPSSPSAASSADCAKMSAQGQCLGWCLFLLSTLLLLSSHDYYQYPSIVIQVLIFTCQLVIFRLPSFVWSLVLSSFNRRSKMINDASEDESSEMSTSDRCKCKLALPVSTQYKNSHHCHYHHPDDALLSSPFFLEESKCSSNVNNKVISQSTTLSFPPRSRIKQNHVDPSSVCT